MKRHLHIPIFDAMASAVAAWPPLGAVWRRALLVVLTLGLLAGTSAQAQAPLPMAVTAAATDAKSVTKAQDQDRSVQRHQPVTVNLQYLDPQAGTPAPQVGVELFDGAVLTLDLQRIEQRSGGNYTWHGKVQGYNKSRVTLSVVGGQVAGTIVLVDDASREGGVYQIQSGPDGVPSLRQIDPNGFPPDHPPGSKNLRPPHATGKALSGAADGPDGTKAAAADSGATIDVMVVYSNQTATAAGAGIGAQIQQAVDTANAVYANSGISTRLRLVHVEAANYSSSGDYVTDLNWLSQAAGVAALRNTYGADLVSMFVESFQYCGMAWLGPSASYGFSVINRGCASSNYSFPHEIGHNFGALHDPYVDPGTSPYAYGHGITDTKEGWRDVMAYNDACAAAGTSCTRIAYFSNPNLTYGNPPDPLGSTATSDVVRVHNQNAVTVANFRASVTGGCSYTLSPISASVGAGAGSGSFTVTAGAGCAWNTVSNAPWLSVGAGSGTTASGTLNFAWAANTGAARSGTFTVGGQTFTVNQASACSYSLTYTSATVVAGGGSGTAKLTTASGCAWTASSSASWLNISSAASGTGSATVSYTVAANTGAARSANLTVGGITFVVTQAAPTAATNSSNVALASAGAVATASSTLSAAYPVAAVNNNERAGVNWGSGGGWADGTNSVYPDWVQITFNGSKSIDRVVVYTVQDNWQNPIEPTDTLSFTQWGITDFTVQGWNGSTWLTLGTVSGNNLVKRSVSFAAFSTDRIRVNVTNALNASSRITEIEAWSAAAVTLAPSTTTLTSSLNPAPAGAGVTFTATVSGSAPSGSVSFTESNVALSGCGAVALTGTGNSRTAACSSSSLAVGTHNIVASYSGDSANAASASTPLAQVITAATGDTNVALASAGAVATASSTLSAAYPVAAVNNNERAGVNWGSGGGWADGTNSVYLDWVQITFNGTKTIDRVVVYTVQDNWQNPIEPTDTLSFTQWGITDFTVQGWNGSAWVTLGTVSGNNLVKRSVSFAAFSTDRIRVNVTNALNASSRITEIEAWGTVAGSLLATTTTLSSSLNPAPVGASVTFTATVSGSAPTGSVNFTDGGTAIGGCSAAALGGSGNTRAATCSSSNLAVGTHNIVASYSGDSANAASASTPLAQVITAATGDTNVALASAGAVATASSTLSATFPVAAVNDNERAGVNWGSGGGWADGTNSVYLDWVQITFNGTKTIDRVVVYTVQDNWQNPIEPTDTLTFTQWGITNFTVQGWNGSSWVTLGTVSGNNLVKRSVSFAAFSTDRIRVNVTNALNASSRITEIEAWGG